MNASINHIEKNFLRYSILLSGIIHLVGSYFFSPSFLFSIKDIEEPVFIKIKHVIEEIPKISIIEPPPPPKPIKPVEPIKPVSARSVSDKSMAIKPLSTPEISDKSRQIKPARAPEHLVKKLRPITPIEALSTPAIEESTGLREPVESSPKPVNRLLPNPRRLQPLRLTSLKSKERPITPVNFIPPADLSQDRRVSKRLSVQAMETPSAFIKSRLPAKIFSLSSKTKVATRDSKLSPSPLELASLPKDFEKSPETGNADPGADGEISGEELEEIQGRFSSKIWEKIARKKRYPRIARKRGYEGRPVVGFVLGNKGQLLDLFIIKSSNNKLLDKAALDAVKRGAPYASIPSKLKLDSIRFNIPISFILEKR